MGMYGLFTGILWETSPHHGHHRGVYGNFMGLYGLFYGNFMRPPSHKIRLLDPILYKISPGQATPVPGARSNFMGAGGRGLRALAERLNNLARRIKALKPVPKGPKNVERMGPKAISNSFERLVKLGGQPEGRLEKICCSVEADRGLSREEVERMIEGMRRDFSRSSALRRLR